MSIIDVIPFGDQFNDLQDIMYCNYYYFTLTFSFSISWISSTLNNPPIHFQFTSTDWPILTIDSKYGLATQPHFCCPIINIKPKQNPFSKNIRIRLQFSLYSFLQRQAPHSPLPLYNQSMNLPLSTFSQSVRWLLYSLYTRTVCPTIIIVEHLEYVTCHPIDSLIDDRSISVCPIRERTEGFLSSQRHLHAKIDPCPNRQYDSAASSRSVVDSQAHFAWIYSQSLSVCPSHPVITVIDDSLNNSETIAINPLPI